MNGGKRKMKKLLEEKLPYPKITEQAEQRIDLTLSMLPDRKAAQKEAEPAHFREEPAAPIDFSQESAAGVERPVRRGLRVAAKCALSLGAACFVYLFLFHWVLPNLRAEDSRTVPNQPGSSLVEAASRAESTVESAAGLTENNEPSFTVDSLTKTGNGVSLTLTLPALPASPVLETFSLPTIRVYTDQGKKLEAADNEMGELTACSSNVFESGPAGQLYTVSGDLIGDLTGVKKLIVAAFDFLSVEDPLIEEDFGKFGKTVYSNGTLHAPVVLGEYTLDLETGGIEITKSFEDKGFTAMCLEKYLAAFGDAAEFQNHMWISGNSAFTGGREAEDAPGYLRFFYQFFCYLDTEESLPYDVHFYFNDELYRSVPLDQSEGGTEEKLNGGQTVKTRWELAERIIGVPEGSDIFKDPVKRYCIVNVYYDELFPSEDFIGNPRLNPFDDAGGEWHIEVEDRLTGEILADSRYFGKSSATFEKLPPEASEVQTMASPFPAYAGESIESAADGF